MISKEHILADIKRTTVENGGNPLGQNRFSAETGIKINDWRGRYWARWGDALTEAGFTPNKLNSAYEDDFLLRHLAELSRKLNKVPVKTELEMEAHFNKSFPSHNTFSRFGQKHELLAKLKEFCQQNEGFDDVIALCLPLINRADNNSSSSKQLSKMVELGFVYLIKSGRYSKSDAAMPLAVENANSQFNFLKKRQWFIPSKRTTQ